MRLPPAGAPLSALQPARMRAHASQLVPRIARPAARQCQPGSVACTACRAGLRAHPAGRQATGLGWTDWQQGATWQGFAFDAARTEVWMALGWRACGGCGPAVGSGRGFVWVDLHNRCAVNCPKMAARRRQLVVHAMPGRLQLLEPRSRPGRPRRQRARAFPHLPAAAPRPPRHPRRPPPVAQPWHSSLCSRALGARRRVLVPQLAARAACAGHHLPSAADASCRAACAAPRGRGAARAPTVRSGVPLISWPLRRSAIQGVPARHPDSAPRTPPRPPQ